MEGLTIYFCARIQINGLRSAYRKVFMPTDKNSKALEERLKEVVLHISLSLSGTDISTN